MNKNNDVASINKGKQLNKSNTLKLGDSPSNKNGSVVETQNLNLNSEKKLVYIKRKSNLKKANNKIINFITDCMEKIKDDKNNDAHITHHLAEIIGKKRLLKERKRTVKKEVHINLNNIERVSSKKSLKPDKVKKKYMSCRNQIYIKNIKNANNSNPEKNSNYEAQTLKSYRKIEKKGTKVLNRINTSKLPKEKEKEIVYNISSSLIALYKPKIKKDKSHFANNTNISNKNNSSNETNKSNKLNNKLKESDIIKYASACSKETDIVKFKNASKRKSNDENFLSSFLNDSPKLKRPSKLKKFATFIKSSNRYKARKSKHKRHSSPNNKNDSFIHLGNDSSLSNRKNLSNYHSNILDETDGKRRKSNIQKFKDWTNDLKNREVLTKREYEHIEKDLIQSLIGYEKTKLEEEMKKIESTETTDLVKRLPTMKNRKFTKSFGNKKLDEGTLININLEDLNLNDKIDKEKFRILQHTGYVYDSLDDEEFEDAIDINNYYISPDSIFIYIFDTIIVISSFYIIFYMPLYLAHDSFIFSSYLNFKLLSFYIIEFIFIVDLLISFFRAYYNYDEVLVNNVYDMCFHFINNWFFIDLLSSIPFYSIFMFLEKNENYKDYSHQINLFSIYGVTINKLHYLLFLIKSLKIFKCFSDDNRALSSLINLLFKNSVIEEKSDIFFIIFILLFTINFGTCLFIFIGRNSYPSWINTIKIENESFISIYICSLYYLIATITTVGYGDVYGKTIKEILFQIILLILGTCTYSYLISSVSNFIKKINEKSLIFENKLKILNDIRVTNPHLQEHLYEKLLRFLRYKKGSEKNKQNDIINSLPYSLKNTLIIEMYKPIINNFIIFKGLENSNCIVQLVTAFKPIYTIKNDILIQEGDFVEELIFVKEGIISLEIGIDFNKPKESIVEYLKRFNDKQRSSLLTKSNTNLLDITSNTLSSTSTFLKNRKSIIKNDKKENKNTHYLKVLDIRKNEHFGETLMFLNERSFLTVKVKSKNAELFFLKKEEVIKIFSNFPNIWNRINKKSIFNMRQIKNTVKRVLQNFCSMCGINLDLYNKDKNKRKSSLLKSINIKKNRKSTKERITKQNNLSISQIKEESLNISNNDTSNQNISEDRKSSQNARSINKLESPSSQDNFNNSYKDSQLNFNNETISLFSRNTSIKYNFNSKTNSQHYGTNINNSKNEFSDEINEPIFKPKINFSCFKGNKNSSLNKLYEVQNKNSSKQSLNEKFNNSKGTVKLAINKKVCSLIDSESLNDSDRQISILQYNVNDEIYKNESFHLSCHCKDDLLFMKNKIDSNKKIKIETLSKRILEKTWLKNMDKEKVNYLDKLLNKTESSFLLASNNISKNDIKEKNLNSSVNSTINLDTIDTESFEIKASYENINEITCNKYIKNSILRNRTKEFLLKECGNNMNNNDESKLSIDNKINKSIITERHGKMEKFESEDMNKSEILPTRNKMKYPKMSGTPFKFGRRKSCNKIGSIGKNIEKKRPYLYNCQSENFLFKNISLLKSPKNAIVNKKFNKMSFPIQSNKELNNNSVIINDNNMSFYDKFNIKKGGNEHIRTQQTYKKRKKLYDSELKEMRHIIKKDAQNLNQPSLYYQKLFLNQIQKRRNGIKFLHKSNLKEFTLLPEKRNKNNSLNININNIKRTSTDLNNVNNNLRCSLKKSANNKFKKI